MGSSHITDYIIGFDLGRDRDHSAIAVLGARLEDHGHYDYAMLRQPTRRIVQLGLLKRIPLGTEYVEAIKLLRRIITGLQCAAGWGAPGVNIHVVVDSAGPGQIAVELIRAQQLNINLVPALLTAGYESGHSQSGTRTVPRRELVANLRYLLEVEIFRVNQNLRYGAVLENEVAAVRPHGGQYAHDDLVIAAGLAAWYATRVYPDILRSRRAA
jgi:hypothetical protein